MTNELTVNDWLREVKEQNFEAKVTVEDALGNKIFFKLQDIEIPFANPYEIQTTTLHVIYEGAEMRTETRR